MTMKKMILSMAVFFLGMMTLSAQESDSNHILLHAQVNEGFYKAFEYPEIKDPEEFSAKLANTMDKILNYPSEEPIRYEGRIVLRFSVYGGGRISHVSVVKGLCPEIDKAARKALLSLRNDFKFSREYRNKVYVQSFYISRDGSIQTKVSPDIPIYALPDTPSHPEGGEEGLLHFLADELVYPRDAMQARLQGRVLVQFVVDEDGFVLSGFLNASDDAASLDFEAARLVGNIPPMKPALQDGKTVRCAWLIPIVFKLTRD